MRYILATRTAVPAEGAVPWVRTVTDSAAPTASAPAPPVVGMVGGGQLARMTSQAATGLGIGFRVLAGDPGESAAQVVAGTRLGDFRSLADLRGFAAGCDVLTFDHEHVPGPHLAALEQDGVTVRPDGAALRFTQDKLAMRDRLTGLGIACPRFAPVRTVAEAEAFAQGSWPLVLKAVSGGYDGKGVWVCESAAEAAEVFAHGPAGRDGGMMRRNMSTSAASSRCSRPARRTVRARCTRWCRRSSGTASAAR